MARGAAAPGDGTSGGAPPQASDTDATESRREFLAAFASATFAGLVATSAAATSSAAMAQPGSWGMAAQAPSGPLQPGIEYEDVLVRMQRELVAAQARPGVRKWVMVIDTRKCTGCHACTIACVAEHKLPPGVVYRPVIEEELGTYPHVTFRHTPRPCLQCDNPPCVPVCPVGATWKSPDGIVDIDYEACIGCRYCLTACPYQARTSDFGEDWTTGTPGAGKMPYETLPVIEYGKSRARKHGAFGIEHSPIGNARKCHFCRPRIAQGLLPQCVTSCIGRATFFGDASDPDALVTSLMHRPNATRLKEALGTEPRVYHLV
jgi:Fe-S-cluster-containing dehydrogenase component